MTNEPKINGAEVMTNEQLDEIAGGTREESKLFRKTVVEKGWASSEHGMASGMAANQMLKVIGIPHVNWHANDNAPADFWDNNGNHYTFETVMEKIRQLPDKK